MKFKIHAVRGYSVIANGFLRLPKMSLKAKGLLALMLSLPDDWDYSAEGLTKLTSDGRDAVRSALRELERFGYLVRSRKMGGRGRFTGVEYDVYDHPNPATDEPEADSPMTDYPATENPTQQNNYIQSKDLQSKEGQSKDDVNDSKDVNDVKSFNITEKKSRAHDGDVILSENDKATVLTNILITGGYIDRADPFIPEYNAFIEDLEFRYDRQQLRNNILYFSIKMQRNKNPIADKLAYFKQSLTEALENGNGITCKMKAEAAQRERMIELSRTRWIEDDD